MPKYDMSEQIGKIVLLVSLFASGLYACSSDEPEAIDVSVGVEQAYMPALAPGQTTAAVYMKMMNHTDEEKVLNHVETDVAGMAHIHRNFYEDGVMKMRMVHHLTLAPKETLRFEPGGYHVMLMDIAEPMEPDVTFPLVLHFEKGESMTVPVTVKARQ